MTKLSPKSAANDPPLSSKVESFVSSSTQDHQTNRTTLQREQAKNANRASMVSMTEAKVPLTVNASKNLFDAVDKEFKEQPTQLVTDNSRSGPA